MPVARFQMPDGRIARFEVPEGTTPEQAQSMAGEYFNQPKSDNFFSRVGEDLSKRNQMAKEIGMATRQGKQTKAEEVFQLAGKVGFGAVGDVIGEGAKSLATGFKNYNSFITPDYVENQEKISLERMKNSPGAQMIKGGLSKASQAYGEFAQNNPRAARNIEAGANIASFYIPVKGQTAGNMLGEAAIGTAKAVPKTAVKAVKPIKEGVAARGVDELSEASNRMKTRSTETYQKFREVGGVLNKNRASNMMNRIDKSISESGKLNARLHGDTLSVLKDLKSTVKKGPVGLEELDLHRQLLSDVVRKNTDVAGKLNPDAFKALKAMETIDDIVENLKPIDIVGGKTESITLLKEARSQWSKYRTFDTISSIIRKADGDPNKIKAGFKRFADNPKNLRGLTNEEKKVIREAGRQTAVEGIFKSLGKFGFDFGSSTSFGNTALPTLATFGAGVGLGTAPLVVGGTLARQGQKYLARGKAEKVLKTIEAR